MERAEKMQQEMREENTGERGSEVREETCRKKERKVLAWIREHRS